MTEYTLQCFGGAGGQHACLVADELGMKQVYIHPLAGVLSAYGMGLAQVRALREEAVENRLEEAGPELAGACDRLAAQCEAELAAQGESVERVERRVHLKYEGTDSALAVPLGDAGAMRAEFERLLPRLARGVTTNTRFMHRKLLDFGVPKRRIIHLPNGVDRSRFAAAAEADVEALGSQLGPEGRRVILYLGSMSLANHAVDLLLVAFVGVVPQLYHHGGKHTAVQPPSMHS